MYCLTGEGRQARRGLLVISIWRKSSLRGVVQGWPTVFEAVEVIPLKRGESSFRCPRLSTVTVACTAEKRGCNVI